MTQFSNLKKLMLGLAVAALVSLGSAVSTRADQVTVSGKC